MQRMHKIAAVRCCWCIRLKTGCYILAFVCLLLLIRHFVQVVDSTVQACYTGHVGQIEQYVMFLFAIFTAIAIIYLIYGLKLNKRKPLKLFLIIMALWIILFILMSSLLLVTLKVPPPELETGTCPNHVILWVDMTVGCIFYLYLMYIVFSYLMHGDVQV